MKEGSGARGGLVERGLVLALVIICVVLLPIAGLAFYAMHRSKPSRLKLSATLLRLFSFSIEVEAQDEQRDELPPGPAEIGAPVRAPRLSSNRKWHQGYEK